MAWARQRGSGKWQGQYRDGLGKVRSAGTFDRKQAALDAAKDEAARIRAGVWRDPSQGRERFEVFAAAYLDMKRKNGRGLKPKGDVDLAGSIRNHLNPFFGQAELRGITRGHVQTWVAWMTQRNKSPHTIRKNLRYLHAILQEAYLQEKLDRNPATRISIPASTPRKNKFPLTPIELQRLADAISPRFFALILLAGYVGLRAAEIAGLRVQDLDLASGFARIEVTNSEVGGRLYLTDTKIEKASVDEVPLPPFLCEILKAHLAHFPSENGFVFTSPEGKPLRWRNFYDRHFKPAVRRAGIDDRFEFRWLRDTSITNARHLGKQSTKVVQRIARHSSEAITRDTYTGLHDDAFDGWKEAMERINAAVVGDQAG